MNNLRVRTKHDVVYNIYQYKDSGIYLPNAFIVSIDKAGFFAHIRQKAFSHTIPSFGLALTEERLQLFRIIEELQEEKICLHYKKGRRKIPTFDQLLEDKVTVKSLKKLIDRKMGGFYQLISKHALPLCLDVERKVLVKDFIIQTGAFELQPKLSFHKKEEGVIYKLTMHDQDENWMISSREIIPVCNHTAYIVANYRLYHIPYINGNMVKPFIKKDEVRIPPASVQEYFRKFILRVANATDVVAEGFGLIRHDTLTKCILEPQMDIFSGKWGIMVYMVYEGVQFLWSDQKQSRTSLEVEDDEIKVVKVKRNNATETFALNELKNQGLISTETSLWSLEDTEANVLYWLADHQKILEEKDFVIEQPLINGQLLEYSRPSIVLDTKVGNDWLDIHAIVKVGLYSLPFSKFRKHIINGIKEYILPDGKIFLIPEEWFAKYKEFLELGKIEGERIRLLKSQFPILEDIGIWKADFAFDKKQKNQTPFKPSALLKATLRNYQLEGVEWLVHLYQEGLGACLADDMGLGKTLQTIALLLHAKENKSIVDTDKSESNIQLSLFGGGDDIADLKPLNALIVLPASLVFNWQNELNKFAPTLTVYKHVGAKRHKDHKIIRRFDIVLTTYQTALRDEGILSEIVYEYIILDESQYIKNRESKVFKSLARYNAIHRLSLSGTPIENSLSDLWAQMQFINPELLGSFNYFKKEFIRPIEKLNDESKKLRLRKLVEPYLLRRTKEEVAKDLPDLSTSVIYTEMSPAQKKYYEREKSAARNYLLDNFAPKDAKYRLLVLQTLTKLRQLVNHPVLVNDEYTKGSGKMQDVIEQFETIQKAGHKVLIFSSFVKYLELFKNYFDNKGYKYFWLTGSVPPKQREKEVKNFENNQDIAAFLISIKAGGAGLNLTSADYVFILDPWWNPTVEQQAIARAHRIGQKNHVFAMKFITLDSIEEKILKLQGRKSQLAEDIIGQSSKLAIDKNEIEYLLQ